MAFSVYYLISFIFLFFILNFSFWKSSKSEKSDDLSSQDEDTTKEQPVEEAKPQAKKKSLKKVRINVSIDLEFVEIKDV